MLEEITKSNDVAMKILEASRSSVGQDNNEIDMVQIITFCKQVSKQY